jgi:hypothetical protein
MAEDLHAIRREEEVERLDREWAQRAGDLMIRDKHGNASRPSAGGGIFGAVIMGVFGVIWTVGALSVTSSMPAMGGMGGPSGFASIFPCFGVVFIIGAVVMGLKQVMAAGKYDEEESRYQARRRELMLRGRTKDEEQL